VKVRTTSTLGGPALLTKQKDGDGYGYWQISEVIEAEVLDAPWHVTFRAEADDDLRMTIRAVTITAREGGPPIASSALRGVALGEALREAIQQAATEVEVRTTDGRTELTVRVGGDKPTKQRGSTHLADYLARPSRTVMSQGDLEAVCEAWEASGLAGGDRYRFVAETLNVGRSTAAERVKTARDLGLISRGRGGRS
jgi:hypothetical protein